VDPFAAVIADRQNRVINARADPLVAVEGDIGRVCSGADAHLVARRIAALRLKCRVRIQVVCTFQHQTTVIFGLNIINDFCDSTPYAFI